MDAIYISLDIHRSAQSTLCFDYLYVPATSHADSLP
jgi:hypothetical protein